MIFIDLLTILVAILIVVLLYKVAVWFFAKLKVGVDNDILVIGAIILLILVLLGRVKLGL